MVFDHVDEPTSPLSISLSEATPEMLSAQARLHANKAAVKALTELEEFPTNMQYFEFHGSITEEMELHYRGGFIDSAQVYRIAIKNTECGTVVTFHKADLTSWGFGLIHGSKPSVINVYTMHELLMVHSEEALRELAHDFIALKDYLDMAITVSEVETASLLEEARRL